MPDWHRSRPAPNRSSAPSGAWRVWAASGMPRRYRSRARRHGRWPGPSPCSRWWRAGSRRCCRRVAAPLLALAAVSVALPAAMATGPGLALLRAVTEVARAGGAARRAEVVALAMPGYALAGAGAVLGAAPLAGSTGGGLLCAAARCWRACPTWPGAWAGRCGRCTTPRAGIRWPTGSTPIRDRWRCCRRRACAGSSGRDMHLSLTRCRGGFAPRCSPAGSARRGAGRCPAKAARPARCSGCCCPEPIPRCCDGRASAGGGGRGRHPRTTGSADDTLGRLPVAYRDPDLTLYRVGGPADQWSAPAWKRSVVLAAHLLWAGLLTGGAAVLFRSWLVRSGLVRSRR